MKEPPIVITQEELEDHLLGWFSGIMDWFAPLFISELVLNIRSRIATDAPLEKAYIEFDNIPGYKDLFWYQDKKSDMMDEMKSGLLAFDEEKGMLALSERIKEWNEKHAGKEDNGKDQ